MELRGAKILLQFLIFFLCGQLKADQWLSPTEVSAPPVDELGSRRTTRPTETITNDTLQSEQRPFSDALNTLPGIQARFSGSPTISFRGSLSSTHSLIFTDGAALNFSDGTGFNPLFIATENIDHITVLKGPASSLFGHDALAGALEIDTEKLKSSKAFSSYGSFNTTEIFAGSPFNLFSAKAQVTVYQSHSDGNYPFSTTQEGFSGARARNDQELERVTLSASSSQSDFLQWKTFNLIARQIGSTPGALDDPTSISYINNWGELNFLELIAKISDSTKVGSRSTFKFLRQDSFGSPAKSQSFKEGLSLTQKMGDHEVEFFDDVYFETFSAAYLGSGQPYETLNEVGASDLVTLSEHLSVQPALRFSNESGGIVPSLGVIAIDNFQTKYFFNYTEGFHPPSITQLYTQSPTFIPNPNLTSEHSTEFDLGIEKSLSESFLFHGEIFNRDIYNFITNQRVGLASKPINLGHARANGIDFSLKEKGSINWGLNADYLNNVETETNSPVPLSPRIQTSAYVSKTFKPVTVMVQETFWSDYYDLNPLGGLTDLSSWNTTDVFLSTPLSKSLDFKLTLLNIFNQERELTLSYPEPQFSYLISIEGYL